MRRLPPPFWFLSSVLVMALLHGLAPIRVVLLVPWSLVGLLPIGAGVMLAKRAMTEFLRASTPLHPDAIPTAVVSTGPFARTRNPMYLSLTILLVGFALLLGTLAPWFVLPAWVLFIDRVFIRVEEQRLAEHHGEEFAAYCNRVRRWL